MTADFICGLYLLTQKHAHYIIFAKRQNTQRTFEMK